MTGILFAVAAGAQALYLLTILIRWFREWFCLRRFVRAAASLPDARRAATKLTRPFSALASKAFGHESVPGGAAKHGHSSLRRTLAEAVDEPLVPPWPAHVLVHSVLVLLALAPFSVALIRGTLHIPEVFTGANVLPGALAYLSAGERSQELFERIREGTQATAWLTALLAIAWAAGWWLHRPEAREARFVRSLLDVTARLKPTWSTHGDLAFAKSLAPSRSLKHPAIALALWVVAVSAGWLTLVISAPIRATNPIEPRFHVLEPGAASPPSTAVSIPIARGGRALGSDPATLRLSVGPDVIRAASSEIGVLSEDRRSVERWDTSIIDRLLEADSVRLYADDSLGMHIIKTTLQRLSKSRGTPEWEVAYRREMARSSGKPLYVSLPVLLDDDLEADVELHVRPTDVLVNRSARLSFSDPDWASGLRRSVRAAITAESLERRTSVRVLADDAVRFDRFVAVLGAADDGCLGDRDCGLPGMGLRFALVP